MQPYLLWYHYSRFNSEIVWPQMSLITYTYAETPRDKKNLYISEMRKRNKTVFDFITKYN